MKHNCIFLNLFQTLMSVSLILYLLSMPILLTTVMVTPTAPTPKDRSTARVIRDTRETEFCVLVILLDVLRGI